MTYHKPVLLKEVIAGLKLKETGVYVDLTFGGGGHSKAILNKLTTGRLYAFDQDVTTKNNNIKHKNFKLINANFRDFKKFLRIEGVRKIDGLLADLGVSSHQIDMPERGFSFRFDSCLDMRMNSSSKKTAYNIVNNSSKEELEYIFSHFGELRNSRSITDAIISSRKSNVIKSTQQFIDIVSPFNHEKRKNKFLPKLFQAIRIVVNDEIESLKEMLIDVSDILNVKGRLVVISYHSLEDRLVKYIIKHGNIRGEQEKDFFGNIIKRYIQINKKVIVPGEEEINENPRSRSAKLRIAEKTTNV